MTPAPTRRAGWAGAAETEQRLNATEPDGGNGWSREKTGERLEIVSTTSRETYAADFCMSRKTVEFP